MKAVFATALAAVGLLASTATADAATNECRGIQSCIRVPGPWVLVPAHGSSQFLLSCPRGRSVVAGLDAQATSRAVHVWFDARIGAPVSPGVSTTTYALFRAVSTSNRAEVFQPRLGCVPAQGGGGRSTVSARVVTPVGPAVELRSRIVIIGPGQLKFAKVACKPNEKRVGSWHSTAFRVKQPPTIGAGALVQVTETHAGRQVVVTASATDGLSIDVHAIVQVGAVCVQ
jgi:hypothetical protein